MDYRVKVIIDGIEITETSEVVDNSEDGVTYMAPSISNIILTDNATAGTMQIGATPSDQLTFTINDPNKQNYDGSTVELWLAPPDDDSPDMEEMSEIEDEVDDAATDEAIEENEDSDELDDEDDSEGEDATAEDLEDAAEATAESIENLYLNLEGEDVTVVDVETEEEEEPEWYRLGIFYVQNQTNADDGSSVTLVCYDGMQKLNGQFTPTARQTTIQSMFNDLRSQVYNEQGISIDAFDFDTAGERTITWPVLCSYRTALGYFAGLIGAFATCGDDGTIGFSMYSFIDGMYLDSTLVSINTDGSGEMELDGIRCNIGTKQEEFIEAGFEPDISFDNPLMTQSLLEDILTEYKDLRFSGGVLNMAWDESIHAGSFIRILSPDEYTNYLELTNALEGTGLSDDEILTIKEGLNSLGRVFLISYQVIDFTGDATTTIRSICDSVTATQNQMTSPTDAKFRNVYAELIQTEQLIAEKADITDLNAQNAVFTKVLAESMNVTNLTGAKADFATLLAGTFTAAQITTLQGYFDTAVADSLTAETVASKTGTFETLAAGSFTAAQVKAASAAFSKATIGALTATRLDTQYANIDFANVTTEAVKNLFVNVGILENAVIDQGRITGTLSGVTVVADLIQASAIVAGDLIVQDENNEGVYYKINPTASGMTVDELDALAYEKYVSGEYIVARSITADQIAVSDLVAFGATIAGLQMASGKIYTAGKTSVSSSSPGLYIDSDGQMNTGSGANFIKSWYDTTEQKWKVSIRADEITLGSGSSAQPVMTSAADAQVIITASNINWAATGNSTAATLSAALYVEGVLSSSHSPSITISGYKWYKNGTEISGQTSSTLTVTGTMGLDAVYDCAITWTEASS